MAAQINSQWQKQLSLYFSLEQVPPDLFEKRMQQGDYSIALVPVQTEGGSVYEMLLQFTAEGGSSAGYTDPDFAADLAASTDPPAGTAAVCWPERERRLLADGVFAPLFAQQKRLLLADGVEGLVFDPLARCWTLPIPQKPTADHPKTAAPLCSSCFWARLFSS